VEELFKNNDKILVQKIIDDDVDAKNYLINRYQEKITWFIKKKLAKDRENWKDLVNDTILAVFENIKSGRYDSNKGELGSYIYGIAKNRIREFCKEEQRNKSKESIEEDIKDPTDQENWENKLWSEEQIRILRFLLKKLKPKYQKVLHLRYYEGLSMRKIGEEINKSEQQVINLHDYALKKIRKECEKKNVFSIFFTILIIYMW
jgi:RNA polymerase sigma-70 factor (ECF subfamily)